MFRERKREREREKERERERERDWTLAMSIGWTPTAAIKSSKAREGDGGTAVVPMYERRAGELEERPDRLPEQMGERHYDMAFREFSLEVKGQRS